MLFTSALLLPATFFVTSVVSRFVFRWTQSRFQIAGFSAAAAGLSAVTSQVGWGTAVASAAAATVGILLVKLALEGWRVGSWVQDRLRDVSKLNGPVNVRISVRPANVPLAAAWCTAAIDSNKAGAVKHAARSLGGCSSA